MSSGNISATATYSGLSSNENYEAALGSSCVGYSRKLLLGKRRLTFRHLLRRPITNCADKYVVQAVVFFLLPNCLFRGFFFGNSKEKKKKKNIVVVFRILENTGGFFVWFFLLLLFFYPFTIIFNTITFFYEEKEEKKVCVCVFLSWRVTVLIMVMVVIS